MNVKHTLRKKYRTLRHQFSEECFFKKSQHICTRLESQNLFQSASGILFFSPFDREPDILPLAKKYWTKKEIYFPRIENNTLLCAHVTSENDFTIGKYGILEPKSRLPHIAPKNIPLLLIPAIALDKNGNRLGFGKGYYDKFLPTCSQEAIAMGIIFQEQYVDSLPHEAHDIPVTHILTDEFYSSLP